MAKFEVILKNNKTKQYDSMAMFIILLNIAVFITVFFYAEKQNMRTYALTGASLAAIILIVDIIYRKKGKNIRKLRETSLAFTVITWAMVGNNWAFLLCAILLFLYSISQRQLLVGVDKEAVLYPSFPKRTIEWNKLNNVVLKDGLLTIDFKNDKLLQSEIIESSTGLNEREFNEFCREQLK